MAILTKGNDFSSGDSVPSTSLDVLVDSAAFVSGASGTTDDSTLEVTGGGQLAIKDGGVTSAKLAASCITTSKMPDSTGTTDGVTFAKMQYLATNKVIGNVSGATAAPSAVAILDEDDMASDSATSLATQQSIKAYVDSRTLDTSTASTSFAKDTEYQNTSGRPIIVVATADCTTSLDMVAKTGAVSGSLTTVARQYANALVATSWGVTFIVPSSYYWRVNLTTGGTTSNVRIETVRL